MPFIQHPPVETDVLQMQFDPLYNKEQITLATGTEQLQIGAVLGRLNSNGLYTDYNNGVSNGTQTAVAILAANVTDSGSNIQTVAWVRGPAMFAKTGLKWHSGQAQSAIDAGINDLKNIGLVAVDAG